MFYEAPYVMCMKVHFPVCLLTDQHVGRDGKPRSWGLYGMMFTKPSSDLLSSVSLGTPTSFGH